MQRLKRFLKENQYYPTPKELVQDIFYYVVRHGNWHLEETRFLEPCAGDGVICREVRDYFKEENKNIVIDCIEVEKVLSDSLKGQGFNVVWDNFETFESIPFYDLIFMNPPFNEGDKFLLKAYDVLNSNGKLICLLNAETIRNPCNKDREIIANLIKRCGEVEFIQNAFSDAERKSDVEIAVVILQKPTYENEFDIFGNIKKEVLTEEEKIFEELKEKVEGNQLMPFDKIDNAMTLYRNCVKQIFDGINAIQQIKTGLSYIDEEAKEFNIMIENFIEIMLKKEQEEAKEECIKDIRKMAWSYVLKFCKMDSYLFHKQRQDFYNKLDKGSATLPFTKDNILQFFDNLFLRRNEYFKEGIIDLFEEITSKHNGNPYHREGWKTNKNWKIGKKIIVDWGIKFDCYGGDSGRFYCHYDKNWIDDLDNIVRKIKYLGESYTIKQALNMRFNQMGEVRKGHHFYNEVETAYFKIKFYKKRTLHIIFKDEKILNELNLIGAKMRRDLGYDDWGK